MINKKEKKTLSLIFDPPSFWYPHPFGSFGHPPVNDDLETSKKKRCYYDTDPKLSALNGWVVTRSKKRNTWLQFLTSVSPAFKCSVSTCHMEGTLLT